MTREKQDVPVDWIDKFDKFGQFRSEKFLATLEKGAHPPFLNPTTLTLR